jgi:hypothetical protein
MYLPGTFIFFYLHIVAVQPRSGIIPAHRDAKIACIAGIGGKKGLITSFKKREADFWGAETAEDAEPASRL